jgi:hypothetical protein
MTMMTTRKAMKTMAFLPRPRVLLRREEQLAPRPSLLRRRRRGLRSPRLPRRNLLAIRSAVVGEEEEADRGGGNEDELFGW